MAIASKDDFVFLGDNALKNITVSGKPLPVRHASSKGEHPMLGEDFAVLREMMLERKFLKQERDLMSSFSSYSSRSWKESLPVYDKRIRLVSDTVDDEHEEAVATISSVRNGEIGSWIDSSEIPDLGDPLVIGYAGPALNSQETSESNARIDALKATYDSAVASAKSVRDAAVKTAEDTYKAELKAENDKYAAGAEKAALAKALSDSNDAEDQRHSTEEASEKTRHDSAIADISSRLHPSSGEPEITPEEAWLLTLKENEKHALNVRVNDNTRTRNKDYYKQSYDIAVIAIEETHDENLTEITKKRDKAVEKATVTYEDAVDKAKATFYDGCEKEITVEGNTARLNDLFCIKGWLISKDERDEDFGTAYIRDSFAHKWYERKYLYERASTPANRTFADFENLRHLVLVYGGISYQGSGWGSVPFFFCGPQHWSSESYGDSYKDEKAHASLSGFTSWATIEATDYAIDTDGGFYFRYGERSDVNLIEKIVADVIMYRHEEDETAREERLEHLSEAEASACASLDVKFSGKWRRTYDGFVPGDTSGLTEDEKLELSNLCASVTAEYKDACDSIYDTYRDRANNEFAVQRMEFSPGTEDAKSYTDQIDAIADGLDEDLAEAEDDLTAAYKAADEAYHNAVVAAGRTRDDAYEAAQNAYDEAVKANQETFVSAMDSISMALNTRIYDWITDPTKSGGLPHDKGWSAFYSALSSARSTRDSANQSALATKESAEQSAKSTYSSYVSSASAARTAARRTAKTAHDNAVESLWEDADERVEEVYKSRNRAWNAINTAYDSAVSQSRSRCQAIADSAEDTARGILSNAGLTELDQYEWTGYGTFCVRPVWRNGYSPSSSERNAMESAQAVISQAYNQTESQYSSDKKAAEIARWNARKGCPKIYVHHRKRFYAQIEPVGSSVYGSYNLVDVVSVANITVHYKPNSEIGMDLEEYKTELIAEKLNAESRKEAILQGRDPDATGAQ